MKLKFRNVWRVWRQYWPADDDEADVDSQLDAGAAAGGGGEGRNGNSLSGTAETIDLHEALHRSIRLDDVRKRLREAYHPLRMPVPDLHQAQFHSKAILHGSIQVRTEASGRPARFVEVRLNNSSQHRHQPEWATVLCFVQTSDGRQWAFVQPYSFEHLCQLTGAPVVLQEPTTSMIPLAAIAHPIQIMPFPESLLQRNIIDGLQRYWICWWTATGPLKYDQQARYNINPYSYPSNSTKTATKTLKKPTQPFPT